MPAKFAYSAMDGHGKEQRGKNEAGDSGDCRNPVQVLSHRDKFTRIPFFMARKKQDDRFREYKILRDGST